jgi:hypothetical protein
LLLATCVLAGCSDTVVVNEEPDAVASVPDERPLVTILSPSDGAEMPEGPITISTQIDSFTVTDDLGQQPVEGQGHLHFFVDVDIPTDHGEPAITEEGTYQALAATSVIWVDVEPGPHTFSVQLVNNDHTPLDVPAVDTVDVQIVEG